jgi:hypothetical protein
LVLRSGFSAGVAVESVLGTGKPIGSLEKPLKISHPTHNRLIQKITDLPGKQPNQPIENSKKNLN